MRPSAAELRRCTAASGPPSSAVDAGGGEPCSASRPLAIRSASRSSPPSSWSAGTRQSSKTISPVCEARQPSLSSLRNIVSPGVPLGTMNTPCPRWPASGSTVATTTWTSAIPPLPMNTFWPSITQSSPSLRARVWIDRTSLPPLGSVTARAASLMSSAVPKHSGAQRISCSSVAAWRMAASDSAGMTIERPIPAQPQNSSSMRIGSDRPVGSTESSA